MATWARSSLVMLLVLTSIVVVHSTNVAMTRATALVQAQPFGPSVHKTYWLVGGTLTGWNGSGASLGPLTNANDGDNVTIMLRSSDGITHSWFIDFNSNDVVDPNELPTRSPDFSSSSSWLNFTFSAALGKTIPHGDKFLYLCAQHAGQMYGRFTFNAGPIASFTHSPSTPLVGHSVSLDGSTSWPTTNATITNFTWNFADGNTTSSGGSPAITHTYATNKTYTVILTITDTASQTTQAIGNVTVLSPPPVPFDYKITTSPVNATIFEGQSTAAFVSLSLVSGSPENVSLSISVSPATSTVQVSLNVTSGFPLFHARLFIITGPANGIYNVTIMAISSTGVLHNSTFTLDVKPSPTPPPAPPNYLFYAAIGGIVALAILAVFLVFRRHGRTKL